MIDLSLTKLALIGVVALVVIGPEKLPKVARMLGALLGRAQRYINDVKSEVSRDMALDELHNLKREVQEAAQDIESSLTPLRTLEAGSAQVTANLHQITNEQFALKAKNFRRQKSDRLSVRVNRQRNNGRTGLRTGASRAVRGTAGSKCLGFF
jgi:sec-independent protein translocase protein TatB